MTKKAPSGPRCAALVGPYLSGKTSLLEAMLAHAGALHRKGTAKERNTVGDAQPESRDRQMSTEINVASCDYLGDAWTFIDCPGSIELSQETVDALTVCDIAVIVCEPEVEKSLTVAPLLKFLGDRHIPHLVFINKVDTAQVGIKDTLTALQGVSERPLVLREIPIRDGDNVTGHVDLVSERAFKWNPNKMSDLVQMPETVLSREQTARNEMLEALAEVRRLGDAARDALSGFDVFMAPAAPGEAPVGVLDTGPPTFQVPWHLLGMPALTLPLFEGAAGMPIGLQLVGHVRDDDRLFAAARWVERKLS